MDGNETLKNGSIDQNAGRVKKRVIKLVCHAKKSGQEEWGDHWAFLLSVVDS